MFARATVLCVAALLAGCSDADEPAVTQAAAEPDTKAAAAAVPGASPASRADTILPILLDGSTATQALVCVASAPPCLYHEIVPGTSDLMLEGVVGRVVGGNLTLEWTPASAATEELAFGVMLMRGQGDECAPINLGMLKGASPLQIEVKPSERPICSGEALHVWASNGIYLGEDPAYAQLDIDQPFHLEGAVTLRS